MLGIIKGQYLLYAFFLSLKLCRVNTSSDSNGSREPRSTKGLTYRPPGPEKSNTSIHIEMKNFESCDNGKCFAGCGANDAKNGFCDPINPKLCMCSAENFYSSKLDGVVSAVDESEKYQKNCSIACKQRSSYGKIWHSPGGITSCDPYAYVDVCKQICQTETAACAFNGICLCEDSWSAAFNESLPFTREEDEDQDKDECLDKCSNYNQDYVSRIFDTRLDNLTVSKLRYRFGEKFCLCGPELNLEEVPETKAMVAQGFVMCSGLDCKRRCGMDNALCEPVFKRACLCNREQINLGSHLWSRLPSHDETKCFEACINHDLDARVIEWNPFFDVKNQKYDPHYRNTEFHYLYEGKFCHCIRVEQDMHQYRPCTVELCIAVCGHYEATCDSRTRRACICNTHRLAAGLGRIPDPGEMNCDIACRFELNDARILDIRWDIPVDHWGVKIAKYCACIRPVSPADLSHCDPLEDECPTFCDSTDAYCTREKYCHCGINKAILNNPLVRLGNGKEQDECGEKCHSWTWPFAEDTDNMPYIYDESLAQCEAADSCPMIDISPWTANRPDAMVASLDALRTIGNAPGSRKVCLCAKSSATMQKPGSRVAFEMSPFRVPVVVPCVLKHICVVVNNVIHIIG